MEIGIEMRGGVKSEKPYHSREIVLKIMISLPNDYYYWRIPERKWHTHSNRQNDNSGIVVHARARAYARTHSV